MTDDEVAHVGLGLEAGIALLKHRCRLISFDEPIDDAGIIAGEPAACLRIMRFLFMRFSEALSEHLEANGCRFDEGMSDDDFAQRVIAAWPLLAPERTRSLGQGVTAENMLARGHAVDRLLFTLQCVFVCTEKHRELVHENNGSRPPVDEALAHEVWGESMAQPLHFSAAGALSASASSADEDTVQWMVRAYREQLRAVVPADAKQDEANLRDGPAWMASLAHLETDRHATADTALFASLDPAARATAPLVPVSEQATYVRQLQSIANKRRGGAAADDASTGCKGDVTGLSHTTLTVDSGETSMADAEELRQRYAAAMSGLKLGTEDDMLEEAFDDSALNVSFVADCD